MSRTITAFVMTCLIGVVGVEAQAALTEQEVRQAMKRSYAAGCGAVIPLGEHQFTMVQAMQGGDKNKLVKTVKALEEIGVIRVTNLPTMLGHARFRVELREDFDKAGYFEEGPWKCITGSKHDGKIEVVKIDPVKGGKTQWVGAVAYLKVTHSEPSEIYRRYRQARHWPPMASVSYSRTLFSYNIFEKKWIVRTTDSADSNGVFRTNSVTQLLGRD